MCFPPAEAERGSALGGLAAIRLAKERSCRPHCTPAVVEMSIVLINDFVPIVRNRGCGDWGLGIGNLGLGIWDWGLGVGGRGS
jgi:hypothetical protein